MLQAPSFRAALVGWPTRHTEVHGGDAAPTVSAASAVNGAEPVLGRQFEGERHAQ
jgi:hypothetical protein